MLVRGVTGNTGSTRNDPSRWVYRIDGDMDVRRHAILTEASNASGSGRISDSFAPAKPVPVPSRLGTEAERTNRQNGIEGNVVHLAKVYACLAGLRPGRVY